MTRAIWQGPFDTMVWGPNGKTILRPGDEYDVSDADLQSAHWRRAKNPSAATKPATNADERTA